MANETDEARELTAEERADLAAREESARVASIPNDNPMTAPGVWGDEIPAEGLREADVFPPSTVHPPRYGDKYGEPFDWENTAEHHHAAMITGEFQAGHRYPHGGAVNSAAQEARERLATGTTARRAENFEEARKQDRENQRQAEKDKIETDKRGAHEKAEANA